MRSFCVSAKNPSSLTSRGWTAQRRWPCGAWDDHQCPPARQPPTRTAPPAPRGWPSCQQQPGIARTARWGPSARQPTTRDAQPTARGWPACRRWSRSARDTRRGPPARQPPKRTASPAPRVGQAFGNGLELPGLLVGVRLRVGKQLETPNLIQVVRKPVDVGLAVLEILVGARLHVSL